MKQIILSRLFLLTWGMLLVPASQQVGLAGEDQAWELFADGSVGRTIEFKGTDGTLIPAYVRKPKEQGPFPAVVMIHGGGASKQGTYALGRMTGPPTVSFIAEGWVVYSIDFRPKSAFDPIEWGDTVRAVETVRQLSFIDNKRIAMIGGSHGGLVTSRVVSLCNLNCAVACAPAAIDLIEVAKAKQAGFRIIPKLDALISRMEQEYGAPVAKIAENPAAFNHQSAFTEVEKVRCPLLLISGRNDTSSPPSVMQTYAKRLREAGKHVELYLPDNGPHGFYFGRPHIPETDEAARRSVGFIRKYFELSAGATTAVPALSERALNRQRPTSNERPDAGRAERLFQRLDRNSDGRIADEEAAGAPGKRFLRMFDANRDGVVTLDEIHSQPDESLPADRSQSNMRQAASQTRPPDREPIRQLLREGRIRWDDGRNDGAEDMLVRTFQSQAVGGKVSYLIYLPLQYESSKERRFPVVYWLHGGGGTQRDCWKFLEQVKPAMAKGLCPSMIVVGVNGIASSSYSDSRDGELPFESVIIKDLIPHIDATYRTISDRKGRALEGFSMGGFGTLHLGLKYPEMFGALTALGPALLEFGSDAGNVERALQTGPYEGDRDYFHLNDPFYLAEKNARAIRGRTSIRLLDNEKPDTFTHRRTLEFDSLLDQLNIAHEYIRLEGTGHSYAKYYDAKPDAYEFYTHAFAAFARPTDSDQNVSAGYPPPPVCYDAATIHRERAHDAKPVEPFEIMDGLHYVGNDHVSSHLLTSENGLILIDTTMPHEVPWLLGSIRKLDFDPCDVKVVIGTHWHVDHCGGHWYFQRYFGSQTWLHEQDAPLVLSGAKWSEGHKIKLDGTVGTLSSAFPPFHTDRLLTDQEVVEWGGRVFTFHQAPDHTPGTLAIEFPLHDENGRQLRAVILGGLKPGSKVFADSCKRLKNIDAQVWLGSHPFQNDTLAKRKQLLTGTKPNPFIDPNGWQGFLDRMINLATGEKPDLRPERKANRAQVRLPTRRTTGAEKTSDEPDEGIDIRMAVDGQSLRRLPSQWQDYFGIHYARSPEHSRVAWTTVRSYGGPHTGISAATGNAPPRKGPFTDKTVRIDLRDFHAPRGIAVKTAEQLIPELIGHRITAIYLMTNIIRPSVDKAFDKDLAYWALRQIYETYPEAYRYVVFEIGNEVVSGHFDPKGLRRQPGFQPGPAPDGKFFGYDLQWKLNYYINAYLAPSIEVIRQVSRDVYGDASKIKILLGSVNPYNRQNIWFLKTLMDSRFDGVQAPTLKDEPVWKYFHVISVHYMGGSDDNMETMQEFLDLYLKTGKVEGIWNTEDHGGRGGQGPVTIVDRGLRHLAWAAANGLSANQTRIVWYGDNAAKPGGRAREAIYLLGDFLHGRPIYFSRNKLTGANVYLIADGVDEALSRILVAIVPDRSRNLDAVNVRLRLPQQCLVSDWNVKVVQYSTSAPAVETVPGLSRDKNALIVNLSRSVSEPLLLFVSGEKP